MEDPDGDGYCDEEGVELVPAIAVGRQGSRGVVLWTEPSLEDSVPDAGPRWVHDQSTYIHCAYILHIFH